ncbi:hypothetical protein ES711_02075 [Gelidibacter salicanalis]|uniref:Uncharacterized protein n=1 Tax=Gelidibacter salicanalis TaxID=291193 RepID=A0A5C7AQ41_9FLAO|nr:hypothetical protein [Gelidibacter salicanalis]TXE10718.1 hypothetical protein ES711_02075 [Gelidibacter salicanalis]
MIKFFLLAFLILTSSIYCQNKSKVNIFLDENLKPINEASFNEKRDSFIYTSISHGNDSLTVHQITNLIKFGKFDSITNYQIRMLLKRDSKNNHIADKDLILTFRDTLYGFKTHSNFANLSNRDIKNKIKHYDNIQKKCIKRDRKDNYERFYFYNVNKEYNYLPKNFSWIKSSSILNNLLFNNQSAMFILKTNGDYFYFQEIYEKYVIELIKAENWELFVNEYEIAKNTLSKMRFGKLKNLHMNYEDVKYNSYPSHNTQCYFPGDY